LNQNSGVEAAIQRPAVSDLSEDNYIPLERDLNFGAPVDAGVEFQAKSGPRDIQDSR
jgi:hypothetical protein